MQHGGSRGYLLKRFLQIENDLLSERITAIIHPLPPRISHPQGMGLLSDGIEQLSYA
jgi:hypothetical protein